MKIRPARALRGRLTVPGDKSVSHRAGLLAALACGRTTITNYSSSADCASTLEALRGLGVSVERDGPTVRVEGACVGGVRKVDAGRSVDGVQRCLQQPSAPLDCGNSGTTMRLLAGLLAAQPFTSTLVGDESLSRRPMRRVVEPLELMGARLTTEDGHAPLRVEGRRPLRAIEYTTSVASAQVKSCVLLAGLGAEGRTRVRESEHTRDHTERMLRWFGVDVATGREEQSDGGRGYFFAELEGPARLVARDFAVPGDISSAAFLVAAAALLEGSELQVEGVGLNHTRAGVLATLRALGADVSEVELGERCNEPVGDVRARGAGRLKPTGEGANVIRGSAIPALIDELPLLAVVGSRAEGGLEIRDARELRVKESDRINAVVENLRAMGAQVEEYEDGLRVEGPVRLRGARVRSFGDHRIAMAFAVAALTADGETYIEGAEACVAVSFPEFFTLLESVTER